ncbi:hypothetical protein Salat_2046300 [Sesamum alatum]|uniref:Uncharacterized protein n=1 Tax=Sesamum alatum TaxID=300844 RepID=A0AAE1Y0N5_9LAMI|nr:hypothetical protein Salat_2046300 [Sesamum alatum]
MVVVVVLNRGSACRLQPWWRAIGFWVVSLRFGLAPVEDLRRKEAHTLLRAQAESIPRKCLVVVHVGVSARTTSPDELTMRISFCHQRMGHVTVKKNQSKIYPYPRITTHPRIEESYLHWGTLLN